MDGWMDERMDGRIVWCVGRDIPSERERKSEMIWKQHANKMNENEMKKKKKKNIHGWI